MKVDGVKNDWYRCLFCGGIGKRTQIAHEPPLLKQCKRCGGYWNPKIQTQKDVNILLTERKDKYYE